MWCVLVCPAAKLPSEVDGSKYVPSRRRPLAATRAAGRRAGQARTFPPCCCCYDNERLRNAHFIRCPPLVRCSSLARPPSPTHAHTRIYIYTRACVQEIGARGARRLHADHLCVALVCACVYLYRIDTHTHAPTLSLSIDIYRGIVCLLVCVGVCCGGYTTNNNNIPTAHHPPTRTHKHTIPTALRPNGACPTATAAATATTTTHPTHTSACVCVCVVVAASSEQRTAAGESPTRSFGVCTANQTHTAAAPKKHDDDD